MGNGRMMAMPLHVALMNPSPTFPAENEPNEAQTESAASCEGPNAVLQLPGGVAQAYKMWGSNVFRFLRLRGVTADLLEDATQEVFYRVHRRWESLTEPSRRKEWVFGIAGFVAKELVRNRRRAELRSPLTDFSGENEPLDPNSGPRSTGGLERSQLAEVLERLLARLPEEQRLVVVLVRVEGFTAREAGEILRLSPRAVNSRLETAERHLRDWLQRSPRRTP
jgi:RNA polymerase sigma factor (sigma-70 family)